MKDVIERAGHMDEFGYIMMIEFKLLQFEEVLYILQVAGDEIVHTDYLVPFFYEPVAKMGTEKAGSACY